MSECIANAVVFKLLKYPRANQSNADFPEPFAASSRAHRASSKRRARITASDSERLDVRAANAAQHDRKLCGQVKRVELVRGN